MLLKDRDYKQCTRIRGPTTLILTSKRSLVMVFSFPKVWMPNFIALNTSKEGIKEASISILLNTDRTDSTYRLKYLPFDVNIAITTYTGYL